MLLELQYRHDDVIVGAKVTASLIDRSSISRGAEMSRTFDALHAVVHSSAKYGSRLDPTGGYLFLHSRQTAREVAGDKRTWDQLQRSLAAMKISSYESTYLVHLLAAVLHLGNLEFVQQPSTTGASDIIWEDDALFLTICELLCIDQKMLVSILYNISEDTHYQSDTDGQAKTLEQVYMNRDFLAQTIYGAAFDWVVAQVNALLSSDQHVVRTVQLTDFPGTLMEPSYGSLCCNMVYELLNDMARSQLVDSKIENFATEGINVPNLFSPNNSEVIDTVMSILFLVSELPNTSSDTLMSTFANLQAQSPNVLTDYDGQSFTLVHTGGMVRYEIQSLRTSAPCSVPDLSLIHISEPTRLLSISYAVFCLKKKKNTTTTSRSYI
eukprot:TRINITY_DN26012_c0_g1_i1.p1 TRINITY_DN26012_c0_g1~~TRINITY_DN26012_c0_g1_i1.p1  ORF type:complete len:381 (+),score=110.16 TRINITY_DN26012_c0_g1_i1:256-1398(+)